MFISIGFERTLGSHAPALIAGCTTCGSLRRHADPPREIGASVAVGGPTPSVRGVDPASVVAVVVIIVSKAVTRPETATVTAYAEVGSESQTASPVNSTDAANPRSTQPAAKTSDVISAKTFNVASADPPATESAAQTSDAPPAETSNMPSTEAADPASANPSAHSHVTPTKPPAMASSALGLRRGYRDATGKCRGGQNHHQPFQHRMFLLACLMSRRTGVSEVAASEDT
jgi:hypothetical protein